MMPIRRLSGTKPTFSGYAWLLPVLGLLLTLALVVSGVQHVGAADDFGAQEPGRHVYDRAGLLTDAEVRDLETRAAAVERAGAPVVVYLRAQKANSDETSKDARELMDAWDVQSAPNARDGIVIFLNLKPGDLRHGEAAIWAGQHHTDGGNLPQSELRRIYRDLMAPPLGDGQTVAGIGSGLDALASSLTVGPPLAPPKSALQRTASMIAGVPLALLGVVVSAALAFLTRQVWAQRPRPATVGTPTLNRPSDLPPAIASALINTHIDATSGAAATLLDFAHRGFLAIEPQGKKEVALRLLTTPQRLLPFEQAVWVPLAQAANAEGIVPPKQLSRITKRGKEFQAALKTELLSRGWYNPDVSAQQRPLYLGGTVALVLGGLGLVVALIGQQVWGLVGAGLLLLFGFCVVIIGAYFPQTTPKGEEVAGPWHAYKAGINAAASDKNQSLDLDATLPDAVAFGLVSVFNQRIKTASEQGYAPSWFIRSSSPGTNVVAFYPYWIFFHGSVSPSSSSSGGGASSGGAGAGGSF
jgi:uncharacterized membrane protein YgcG